MMRFSVVVLVLWAGGGFAVAQPSGTTEQAAQEFFARGNTAYNLGHFDDAADQFSKAYEAWPQPEFLYNIAQSYRLGLHCKQALHFYKRFRSLKDQDTAAPTFLDWAVSGNSTPSDAHRAAASATRPVTGIT